MAAMAMCVCASMDGMDGSYPALYEQQSALFEEILGEDTEEELVEAIAPADVNADNGTPIAVDPSSVHEEVGRFVQYMFEVAREHCQQGSTKDITITGVNTAVAEGIMYEVSFKYEGKTYQVEVVRTPKGNPKELPGQQEVVRDEFEVHGGFKPAICPSEATWTATEYPQFEGISIDEFAKKFTGDKAPAVEDFIQDTTEVSEAAAAKLPPNFDWREHMGNSKGMKVQKQGECSACYATTAASVMSDRFFIASKGRINVEISAQNLMDCSNGCKGGTANDAFKAMMAPKKASPDWCAPFTGKAGKCGDSDSKCTDAKKYSVVPNGDKKMATLGVAGKDKEAAIMFQVFHYGPVYMRMEVFSDFPYYRSGVYKHQASAKVRGDHAVKLVGWGQEGPLKYWLAQNSWGEKWGERGYFRIARGEDESGVESRGVFWAVPQTQAVCPKAEPCNNGGSFTAECGCHCTDGFTGTTCDVCNKQCGGEGFTGQLEKDKCECACAPGYYDGDVAGTFTKCGLKIGGAGSVKNHAIEVPPCRDDKEQCSNWANRGYCEAASKYSDFTTKKCQKSCKLCDTKKSAQIPVTVEGKLSYQYGDMLVAVPSGKYPWNIKRGWAPHSYYSFVCGPETKFEESLYCEDINAVQIKIPDAGTYDVYFYKFLGKNRFGQSKGWGVTPKKLAVGACAGEKTKCDFSMKVPAQPKGLDEKQKAEVAQRVADAAKEASEKAKKKLEDAKHVVEKQEKDERKQKLKADKLARKALKKKEASEVKLKKAARKKEQKELKEKTLAKVAKDKAAAKEVDKKRAEAKKKSQLADKKRHAVVVAIKHHKKVLNKLGKIAAKMAEMQAHVDATEKEASLAGKYRTAKLQAKQNSKDAKGILKAQMRKAAKLAKAAAAAQDEVKKDTVKEKVAKQTELKKTLKSKSADKAYKINQDFKKKHAHTVVVHKKWQEKSKQAELAVTHAKTVAVAAMENAQCIIKDKRLGCKDKKWKGHCQTKKWKAWMMTHCTASCGFSCTDLHALAMGIVLKAEDDARKKQEKARKESCPKYHDITESAAENADKNGRMATENEQNCKMNKDAQACKNMKKFIAESKKFEIQHQRFKQEMQKLGCYEYHAQWAKGIGAAHGSAAGQKLLRLNNALNKISGGAPSKPKK
jgi:hypothetical protein